MSHKFLTKVPFTRVKIEDQFWAPRLSTHQETTIKACLEQCEKTGRIENFEKTAKKEGEFEGVCFNDSDIYKILEGVGYSLMNNPNEELEKYADEIIQKIGAAQQVDGYLDNYFTLGREAEKWTDMMAHEAYCAGHLIEAAVAYHAATGKEAFLNIAIKLADHLVRTFGDGNRHFTVGHQEVELALVKLYQVTQNEDYLKLSQWFIEERGHHYGFVDIVWNRDSMGGEAYNQDDAPIRELKQIKGHAVRAMYYFCAVTDLAMLLNEQDYKEALDTLWDSTVLRNMYLTGGIGSSHTNEGFTGDYDLPNDEAYCETCASIGMVYWNSRMNLMKGISKYADIIERELYNGALSGLSLDGQKFFYVNPLETDGTHHREEWYGVSCCPTQLARFIPSVGEYVYATSEDGIWVNLYMENTATIPYRDDLVVVSQKTNYPWNGLINLVIESDVKAPMTLYLRYPSWAKEANLLFNQHRIPYELKDGYLCVTSEFKKGDTITIDFPMTVERIHANPKVKVNEGKVALQRGPIVYCFEEVDNRDVYETMKITKDAKIMAIFDQTLLGGVTKLVVHNCHESYTAVPYFSWDNREVGKMKVWVDEDNTGALDALYADQF